MLIANIYWILTVGQAKGERITWMWLILLTDEKVEAQERLSDLSKAPGLRVADPDLANHELLVSPGRVRWRCPPQKPPFQSLNNPWGGCVTLRQEEKISRRSIALLGHTGLANSHSFIQQTFIKNHCWHPTPGRWP